MVTVNIPLDDELLARLREKATKSGRTVEQVAADLLASLSDDGELELTAEQEQAIDEGVAQLDRGEAVSAASVIARLKAQRR